MVRDATALNKSVKEQAMKLLFGHCFLLTYTNAIKIY